MPIQHLRTIKSFIKREGRITPGQQHALKVLWPKFGIDFSAQTLNLAGIFGRTAQTVLEIGFGNGDSLCKMAQADAQRNYIGIEVHRPGVGHLLHLIDKSEISNLRIISADAVDVIQHQIADNSLHKVQLFFPDPWHKKKHNKRRIVQDTFVNALAQKINSTGVFHLATDWQDYAEHMLKVMNRNPHFVNLSTDNTYVPKPDERPTTKFEIRGQKLGHSVWDMLYQKIQGQPDQV
jgi:tRNA (guanine-N7-)-methyltransferase